MDARSRATQEQLPRASPSGYQSENWEPAQLKSAKLIATSFAVALNAINLF
jgi:hypothetical protein